MSQTARVLSWLQTHDGLTPAQAYEQIGSLRLAARVSELREQGYPIVTETYVTPKGARVAFYRLLEKDQRDFGL